MDRDKKRKCIIGFPELKKTFCVAIGKNAYLKNMICTAYTYIWHAEPAMKVFLLLFVYWFITINSKNTQQTSPKKVAISSKWLVVYLQNFVSLFWKKNDYPVWMSKETHILSACNCYDEYQNHTTYVLFFWKHWTCQLK